MEEASQSPVELDSTRIWVVSEQNMALYPFFAVSRQDVRNRRKTEYRTQLKQGDQSLAACWRVTANAEYGHPGPFDRKVFRAIEVLLTRMGRPVGNPIPFSISELCRLLRLPDGGRSKEMVVTSLRRMAGTLIESVGAVYDKQSGSYVSDTRHLIERVVFRGRVLADGTIAEANYLWLGQWYLDNVNEGYTRPLDFSYLLSLRSDLAGRLYELLSARFYGAFRHDRPNVRMDYETLCALLPMAPLGHVSRARQSLERAHEELIRTGYLRAVDFQVTAQGWQIRYTPGPRALADYRVGLRGGEPERNGISTSIGPRLIQERNGQNSAIEAESLPERVSDTTAAPFLALRALLIARGLQTDIAERLSLAFPDSIAEKARQFDWIVAQQTRRISNPAGYLRKMIEEDWAAPEGYRLPDEMVQSERKLTELEVALDKRTRLQRWEMWQAGTSEEKVRGELILWARAFHEQHGRTATDAEKAFQKQRLLEQLPAIERKYRQELLGVSD